MFQPTKEWVNKVNLSRFELENFFKFGACVISARKAKQLDATTMFTYSHANTALGQSERAYYLSYFINRNKSRFLRPGLTLIEIGGMHLYLTNKKVEYDISDTYRGLKYGSLKRIIVNTRFPVL